MAQINDLVQSTMLLLLILEIVYKKHKTQLNFSILNHSSSMKNCNKNILNLFMFRIISILHMFKSMMSLLKHMMPLQKQNQMKMMFYIHMFRLFFPIPSLDIGNKSYTKTQNWPWISQGSDPSCS